jgi:DDE superfamily endonuclease
VAEVGVTLCGGRARPRAARIRGWDGCSHLACSFVRLLPRGKRAFFKVPRNRGKNTTLLASIGCEGTGPSMVVERSTSGEVFEAYVEHFPAPTLRAGQVVVMDNVSAHKGSRVRERI